MLTLIGFVLYAAFAPHSIAGAWIGLALAALGWLIRILDTKRTGLRRTALDLPLWLFFAWTLLSAVFSAEPRVSLAKLANVSILLIFYLAQAMLTRRRIIMLATLMITSGVAGVLWSIGEVARGRGVVVEEMSETSPFRQTTPPLEAGDAIWRIDGQRVSTIAEIDAALRRADVARPLAVSVISRGEHVEWTLPPRTEATQDPASPSGLRGSQRTHRFRASGWTRHYETHAELLQMLAQLALGFALAALQRKGSRLHIMVPAAAFALLAVGIALTAMRTVLVAFAFGAFVVAWRAATRWQTHLAISLVVLLALSFGAFAVSRTRATGALMFQDASAQMRLSVAGHALERIPLRPVFGHGMDAVNFHWTEWGFPGTQHIHMHSTLIQLAFDRGLPALIFWFWLIIAFWRTTTHAEAAWRTSDDPDIHGFLLGTTGALAGFLASSLVNYNFGDAEVALLLWWLMGAVVVAKRDGMRNADCGMMKQKSEDGS
jgi:hypothetical protein